MMKFYIWQKGDCLKKVAEKINQFNTFRNEEEKQFYINKTIEKIIELNQISNSDFLEHGDVIRVK